MRNPDKAFAIKEFWAWWDLVLDEAIAGIDRKAPVECLAYWGAKLREYGGYNAKM